MVKFYVEFFRFFIKNQTSIRPFIVIPRQIEEDRANAVSMRDVELGVINKQLEGLVLSVKEIPSDGNCLFRAVIDQLDSLSLRRRVRSKDDLSADFDTVRA